MLLWGCQTLLMRGCVRACFVPSVGVVPPFACNVGGGHSSRLRIWGWGPVSGAQSPLWTGPPWRPAGTHSQCSLSRILAVGPRPDAVCPPQSLPLPCLLLSADGPLPQVLPGAGCSKTGAPPCSSGGQVFKVERPLGHTQATGGQRSSSPSSPSLHQN